VLNEELPHSLAVPHFADQRLVGRNDAPHLFFDRGQVFLGERAAAGSGREVVIEAVLGRGTEGDLRAREDVLHRLGQHVCEVVPHQLERVLFVARSDQREVRVALERSHDVAHLAVDLGRQRRLGEPRPDRRRDVRRRRPFRHFPDGAIGKGDLEHLGHGAGHVARRLACLNRGESGAI
jgi:hypothetical protein